jgi:hypothetical protein
MMRNEKGKRERREESRGKIDEKGRVSEER